MSSTEADILDILISSSLSKNLKLVDVKLTKLTSSGDNYGSVLLAVDVTVINENHEENYIYLVAKKLPSNELVQEMFNSQYTFPNEVGFYQTIIPCLQRFQKEQGVGNVIKSFPGFYAAEIDKNPTTGKINQNSVLLIENIKNEGFRILDRTVGFDLTQSRFILGKMAELHATVLALNMHKPEVFQAEIFPFLQEYEIFVMDEETNNKMIRGVLDVIRNDEICRRHLEKLEDILVKSSTIFSKQNERSVCKNPFFTLVHSDMWTNNIMVKIIDNRITDVKFVDYQLYEYTSLTRDVVFFLFSSVPVETLEKHCDSLLHYYYVSFTDCLKRLNCDDQEFSFDGFLDDMKINVNKYEFFHIMTMLPPIYATSKDAKDVEQLDMDSFVFHESEVTEEHREKACFVVKEFMKRGWL